VGLRAGQDAVAKLQTNSFYSAVRNRTPVV